MPKCGTGEYRSIWGLSHDLPNGFPSDATTIDSLPQKTSQKGWPDKSKALAEVTACSTGQDIMTWLIPTATGSIWLQKVDELQAN